MPLNGSLSGPTERQRRILDQVQLQGFATIEALAQELGVSAQTVRRDIIQLDAAGLLQRFHGGAGLPEPVVRLGYVRKEAVLTEAKARIGAAAAAGIADGSAVFLDVGTTVEAVARALARRRGLRVFTSSLKCGALFDPRETEVFVTGGLLRGADGSLVGEAATAALAGFRFDVAVIGCSGFEADGCAMDFDLQKVAVKQAAIAHSRRAVLVADRSKFGHPAIVRIAPAAAFAALVSDDAPPAGLGAALEAAGVELVVAGG